MTILGRSDRDLDMPLTNLHQKYKIGCFQGLIIWQLSNNREDIQSECLGKSSDCIFLTNPTLALLNCGHNNLALFLRLYMF